MKPFDPDARCPKCGHDKVSSIHQAAGEGFYLREPFRHRVERIDRVCQRCHFDWSEKPLALCPQGRETERQND